ncbi:MAG: hypothetical protein ACREJC_02300 [Tepidisphaeraceae bacterium]
MNWLVQCAVIATGAAFVTPVGRRVWRCICLAVARPARSNFAGPLIVFVFALAIGATPSVCGRVPIPSVHDEFSYLLAADTFAHGRLTNPPHPLWPHFETIHEIMQPTYASKFPPAQGLALAAGQLLGLPAIGAFGAEALFCALVCWALRAWLPARWALVGGLLAAMLPVLNRWGQTYWGGSVAAIGGALLTGAAARMVRNPRRHHGLILGAGLAILANSRPLEGLIVALICGVIVTCVAARRGLLPRLVRVVGVPMAVVLALVAGWMLYYNRVVTGHALLMPYSLHREQYMVAPIFWWEAPNSSQSFRHERFRQFYGGTELEEYEKQRGAVEFLLGAGRTLRQVCADAVQPRWLMLLLPGAVALLWVCRRMRAAVLLVAGFIVIHFCLTPWMRIQYLAPVAATCVAILTLSLRATSRFGALGRGIAALVIASIVADSVTQTAAIISNPRPGGTARTEVIARLQAEPGRQLVLVNYRPGPQLLFEWVYNPADIDAARVVFARAMSREQNTSLANHFPDRRIWLLDMQYDHYDLALLREPRQ